MDGRVERGMRRQLAALAPDHIGWKIALNAPAAMEHLGLSEPAVGWLSRSRVAERSHSLDQASAPAVEPELLLEAGAGGRLAAMGLALEVVDFDRPLDDVEEVLAHNVFHRAVTFGPLGAPASPGALSFSVNGAEPGPLAPAEDPSQTLAFVSRFLEPLGSHLEPGHLVIAGALAPPVPVSAGDKVSLASEALGSVALEFTASVRT